MAHFKPGQVHYTTLEGIPEGAPVMSGTFSVNEYLVTVLFDSGASHTFISKECAIRLGLKIEYVQAVPYSLTWGKVNHQSICQSSIPTVARKIFSYGPDNVTNPKDRYDIGYEPDGGSGS